MNRRAFFAGMTANLAGASKAHPWLDSTAGLTEAQVDAVIEGLARIGEAARAADWHPPENERGRLMAAIYIYAAEADRFAEMPDNSKRVLLTHEALRSGDVRPDGSYGPDADVYGWITTLHLQDVPVIAGRSAAFDRLRTLFSVEID